MVSIKVTPKKMHWPVVTITHGHALQRNEHMDTHPGKWTQIATQGHAHQGMDTQ